MSDKELLAAAIELRDDLLMRGERDTDGVIIVNASRGRWARFTQAIEAHTDHEQFDPVGGEVERDIIAWLEWNNSQFGAVGVIDRTLQSAADTPWDIAINIATAIDQGAHLARIEAGTGEPEGLDGEATKAGLAPNNHAKSLILATTQQEDR